MNYAYTLLFRGLAPLVALVAAGTLFAQCPGGLRTDNVGFEDGNRNGYNAFSDFNGNPSGIAITTDPAEVINGTTSVTILDDGLTQQIRVSDGVTVTGSVSTANLANAGTGFAAVNITFFSASFTNLGQEQIDIVDGGTTTVMATINDPDVAFAQLVAFSGGGRQIVVDDYCLQITGFPTQTCTNNIITTNFGFEDGTASPFTKFGNGPSDVTTTAGEVIEGTTSVSVTNGNVAAYYIANAVSPGETYTASALIRDLSPNGFDGFAPMTVQLFGGGMNQGEFSTTVVNGLTELEFTVPAGSTVTDVQIFFNVQAGREIIVDNVCIDAPAPSFSCAGNLVTFNPDFETGDANGWFTFSGPGNPVMITGDAAAGSFAGSVPGGQVAARSLQNNATVQDFNVGDMLTFAVDIQSANANLHVYAKRRVDDFGGGQFRRLGNFVSDPNGYTTSQVSFTVPEGTFELLIYAQSINLMDGTQGGQPIQVDNLCVTSAGPDPNFVLPITLADFRGTAAAKHNELYWTTEREENTAMFYLERSADGQTDWAEVATVAAAGNSTVRRSYTATDERPARLGYYRLRSVDFDGAEQHSDVIALRRRVATGELLAYPNPVGDVLTVETELDRAQPYRLADALGRTLRSGRIGAGATRTTLSVADLPAGRYLLSVGGQTVAVLK